MKIDRVNIKKTEMRTRPDSHVAYIIEVQTKANLWTVPHRFSDFLDLHAHLSKEFAIRESLPPKKMFGSSSPEVIEQRRIGLERYLKSLVFSEIPQLAQHKLLYSFLDFDPPAQDTLFGDIEEGNWLDRFKVLENLCNTISIHITNHERALQSGDGNAEELLAAKKKIVQLTAKTSELGEMLNADSSVTEKEMLRRKDMLSKLRIAKDELEQRIKNPRVNSENRSELFKSSSDSQGRGPRVLGKPQETEQTRNLDNDGLVQLQREEMSAQDDQLEQLMSTLKRQAEIGKVIGDELDYQNQLLDELDADVDRTRAKLKKTGKTLIKVAANA